ncbi:MAG TPA: serine/threonine-protein kinase [Actinomycetota bacterium]|nr:serine/threonine-protein kinase [Actinomycetota bacterium]
MSPEPDSNLIAGRYELGDLVASGGMGHVYAARDVKLDRAVAIKFLRPDMAAQPDIRARFEAEARAAGRLSHPHVVGVFDTDEDEGRPFIVMELLSGRTLLDEAAAGPFSEERTREVGLQILSALGASHGQGILHRDLKPGNVLLSHDGSIKVADFGVAKMAEGMHLTQAGMLLGTPAYLAPERIAGEPASEASDLYSVGVILYEMLAGRKPFDADTPLGLMRAIQDDPVPPLAQVRPDVDPALAAAIERAMAKDPAGRFPSAAAMEAALQPASAPAETVEAAFAAPAAASPTRVLESPGSAPTQPTLRSAAPPLTRRRAAAWERLSRRNRMGIAIGAALIVLSLILVRANLADAPATTTPAAETPAGEANEGELPAPLEDALQELEGAVE